VYEDQVQPLPRQELADALSGNLCRCTGYRPILDAGQRMFQAPRVVFDPSPALTALKSLSQPNETFVHDGPEATEPSKRARFVAPATLSELARWREQMPQARMLAGSTDVGLWVTKQMKP